MVIAFVTLLVVHGLIHLLGAAKACGWAELPQLTQPISPAFGALWLVSTLLFLGAAVSLFIWPRGWRAIGGIAVVISMIIIPSWTDAKVGALANAVVLVGVAFGYLSQGPFSLRAEYDRDIESHVSAPALPMPLTDSAISRPSPSIQVAGCSSECVSRTRSRSDSLGSSGGP